MWWQEIAAFNNRFKNGSLKIIEILFDLKNDTNTVKLKLVLKRILRELIHSWTLDKLYKCFKLNNKVPNERLDYAREMAQSIRACPRCKRNKQRGFVAGSLPRMAISLLYTHKYDVGIIIWIVKIWTAIKLKGITR